MYTELEGHLGNLDVSPCAQCARALFGDVSVSPTKQVGFGMGKVQAGVGYRVGVEYEGSGLDHLYGSFPPWTGTGTRRRSARGQGFIIAHNSRSRRGKSESSLA